MTERRTWIALVGALAVAAVATAGADELVTRDGQVIETRGPWEVRGKLVVFRLTDGTLASLRLDEADLEASEERAARETERRARQAREESMRPPPEPPQAAIVLTDRDVAHAPDLDEGTEPADGLDDGVAVVEEGTPATGAGGTGGDEDTAGDGGLDGGAPVAGSGRGVQVVQWSQEAEGEAGLAVRGVVQNLGTSFATSVKVNALFYDESGGLVAAREVQFEDSPLGPGARRDFSVSLPDSLVYDEIKFQVVGRGFRSVGQSVRTGAPPQPDVPDVP